MRSRPLALLSSTLAAAVSLGAAAPPSPQSPPAQSLTAFGEVVEVNVVNVDVYATDKQGHRVNDLKQGDFELLEDGKPVPITNFTPVRVQGAAAAVATAPETAGATAAVSRAPEDAWNLVVYVDDFNIQPAHRTRALRQVRDFLASGFSPGDRVMLVSYDLGLRVRQPFTSDPAALDAALKEVEKAAVHGMEIDSGRRQAFSDMMTIQQASLSDPIDPVPCPQNIVSPAHNFASSRRDEVLRSLGALTVLVNSLSGVPGRKAVLHVSDGLPAVPGEELFQFLVELCGGSGTSGMGQGGTPRVQGAGPREGAIADKPDLQGDMNPLTVYDARSFGPKAYQAASQAPLDAQSYSVAKQLAALVAHANAHRVTLYTLQASGASGTDASETGFGPGDRLFQFPSIGSTLRAGLQESLQTLAEGTGGKAILNANDLRADLAGLREDFSTFYSLGYTPAHNGDGKEHKIEVRAKRAGLRLRYRESYRDKPAMEKAVDRTLAALLYGLEENPLQIAVEIGEQTPGPSGSISVPIRLRIPLHKLAILNRDQTYEGALRVLVATRSSDGRSAPVRQVAVPIKIPRKQVLNALGQSYLYTLTLQLAPGQNQVALGVRDEIAATTSYLSRAVTVGVPQAAAARSSQ
jgi:VWFA-related protein